MCYLTVFSLGHAQLIVVLPSQNPRDFRSLAWDILLKFSDKHPCAEIVWYPVNVAQESEQTFENISVNAFTSRVCIVNRIQSFIVWQKSRLNSWRLELLTAAFDTIEQEPSFHSNWRNRNPAIHKQIHFRDRPGVYLLLLNSTSWIACLFYGVKLCF